MNLSLFHREGTGSRKAVWVELEKTGFQGARAFLDTRAKKKKHAIWGCRAANEKIEQEAERGSW